MAINGQIFQGATDHHL